MENKAIVFAYYKDGEFKGFRADTFNTISKEYAKVYQFSRSQINTVLGNVKSGCNRAWQSMLAIIKKDQKVMTPDGGIADMDAVMEHVSKTDETFREWGEFEVHVIEFPNAEEWYSFGEGDEWKRKQFIENLSPAIEIHKFKVIENEN